MLCLLFSFIFPSGFFFFLFLKSFFSLLCLLTSPLTVICVRLVKQMEHHGAVDARLSGSGTELVHCVSYLWHSPEFHPELDMSYILPLRSVITSTRIHSANCCNSRSLSDGLLPLQFFILCVSNVSFWCSSVYLPLLNFKFDVQCIKIN